MEPCAAPHFSKSLLTVSLLNIVQTSTSETNNMQIPIISNNACPVLFITINSASIVWFPTCIVV